MYGGLELEAKVYDSGLNNIASITFDRLFLDPPSSASYPAGGDGAFAIASFEPFSIIVRIFD